MDAILRVRIEKARAEGVALIGYRIDGDIIAIERVPCGGRDIDSAFEGTPLHATFDRQRHSEANG